MEGVFSGDPENKENIVSKQPRRHSMLVQQGHLGFYNRLELFRQNIKGHEWESTFSSVSPPLRVQRHFWHEWKVQAKQ